MGRPRELGLSVRPGDLGGCHPLPKPLLGSLLPQVQAQALSGLICLLAVPLCSSHPCWHLLPAFKGHFPLFRRGSPSCLLGGPPLLSPTSAGACLWEPSDSLQSAPKAPASSFLPPAPVG